MKTKLKPPPAPKTTVLPYMGKPPPTEKEIKRKHAKSAEAVGTGTRKTSNHIREYEE